MARYTGPKHKLARRLGINVLDKTTGSLQRRLNTPPGMHGKKMKRRPSEYGLQLKEKQKAKAIYGILEKQFRGMVNKVAKEKGDTGELLLTMLETRLDNLVYRLGFAASRFMSRQLVSHGHVRVNGKKVTIPSYQVKEGDIVSLSDKMMNNVQIGKLLGEPGEMLLFLQKEGMSGKLMRLPKRADIEVPFNTQQIIEYYSR